MNNAQNNIDFNLIIYTFIYNYVFSHQPKLFLTFNCAYYVIFCY